MLLKSLTLLFFISAASYFVRSCAGDEVQDDVPLVRLKQGLIKGIKEKSLNGKEFYSYMGIPFAEPPTGRLRFKDPVAAKLWDGVLDGSKMPSYCLQPSMFDMMSADKASTTLQGKEDCLYLNVFTTVPNEPLRNREVMVFIHGGAFIFGGTKEYPPYVLMNNDIIYVSIQYRLGIFGFFSTEDSLMPGNMGLKDQQLALKWVKDNIAAFGGDPDAITIFGESAGGAAVHYQILSPGSNGLFKRAIIQSGTALCPWASNVNHRKFAIETGRQFNCSLDHGTKEFLDCMQNVKPLYLLIASITNYWGILPLYVLPRVDGDFISDYPEVLMKEGKYNKVDIIAGITKDEGAVELIMHHVDPSRRVTQNNDFENYGALSIGMHDEEDPASLARKIYQFYLKREDTTLRDSDKNNIAKMHSDVSFRVCHDRVANYFANDKDINLYLYQFDYFGQHSGLNMIPGFDREDFVGHGDDLVYLFQGGIFFSRPLEKEEDLKFRELLNSMWTNFARTGNPNVKNSGFTWEKSTSKNFRHLSLKASPRMEDVKFDETRKFWSSLKTRQNMNLHRSENKEKTFKKQEL